MREGHVFRPVEGPGHLFGHIRLDDGNIVGSLEEEVVVIPAGGSIGHVDGRNRLDEPAAGNHRHIPGPVGPGQWLKDFLVNLLQFLHEEGVGVVTGQAAEGGGVDHGKNHLEKSNCWIKKTERYQVKSEK